MATIEASIEGALFERILALTLTPALRLSGLTGETFVPAAGEKYLAVQHIPNKVTRFLIGSTAPSRRYGILQVMVVGPKANVNQIDYTEIAGQVAEWFPADLALISGSIRVRITQPPMVAGLMDAGQNWNCPISVQYEVYA